ncbi:MAG: PDZ domain-containing protein [Phycisphaerales bacterium]|jgi:predicted metalloprotease with PDZ domain|nr:PDZ domain-containing protein [Phycisphaerales bacterium]
MPTPIHPSRAARALPAGVVASLLTAPAFSAPPRVEYLVDLTNARTQSVGVTLVLRDVEADEVRLELPVWRPGRYVVLDPVGTLRTVHATNAQGEPLDIEKVRKSSWVVRTGGAREVRVTYDLYANSLADRTRHADDTHAFLSGSSVFMFWPERRGEPCEVTLDMPEGWRIACGLDAAPGRPDTLRARNYDVLVDSPIEAGLHDRIDFDVDGMPFEIAIWGRDDYDRERLARDFQTLCREQIEFFGAIPCDRYVFLVHAAPGAGGGTEHLNSTILQTRPGFMSSKDRYQGFLTLASHEFFHTWNVKSFRPAGIHPYDYTQENYTDLLWVAEGSTSYYEDVLLARADLIDDKEFLKRLESGINGDLARPGRFVQSLADSSFDAWTKFNKSHADTNNTTVNFYSRGSLVGTMLDLEIRRQSENEHSYDDVVRALYQRFPLDGPGYTTDDLIALCKEFSGAPGVIDDFFARFVRGTGDLPIGDYLSVAGLELHDPNADEPKANAEPWDHAGPRAWLGASLADAGGLSRVTRVDADGPAYAAGLIENDEIVAINSDRLHASDVNSLLDRYAPGDTIAITYLRRDELRTIELTLAARPREGLKIRRVKEPSELQKAVYESWLGVAWLGVAWNGGSPAKDTPADAPHP